MGECIAACEKEKKARCEAAKAAYKAKYPNGVFVCGCNRKTGEGWCPGACAAKCKEEPREPGKCCECLEGDTVEAVEAVEAMVTFCGKSPGSETTARCKKAEKRMREDFDRLDRVANLDDPSCSSRPECTDYLDQIHALAGHAKDGLCLNWAAVAFSCASGDGGATGLGDCEYGGGNVDTDLGANILYGDAGAAPMLQYLHGLVALTDQIAKDVGIGNPVFAMGGPPVPGIEGGPGLAGMLKKTALLGFDNLPGGKVDELRTLQDYRDLIIEERGGVKESYDLFGPSSR